MDINFLSAIFNDRLNSLPINLDFASTFEQGWCYEFATTTFSNEHANEIKHQGNRVGLLFIFDEESVRAILEGYGKKQLIKDLGGKPEKIMGLHVPPNTNFPIHADVDSNRRLTALNFPVNGRDSVTYFYKDKCFAVELRGLTPYHFNPHIIEHSVETKSEPLQLIQFFY